jgi:hypothetical protein
MSDRRGEFAVHRQAYLSGIEMTRPSDRGKGIQMRRGVRAIAYAFFLLLLGVLLFVPGLELAVVFQRWGSILLALLHGTVIGPFLPPSNTILPKAMVLAVTSAAFLPRTTWVALRARRFLRRRRILSGA